MSNNLTLRKMLYINLSTIFSLCTKILVKSPMCYLFYHLSDNKKCVLVQTLMSK